MESNSRLGTRTLLRCGIVVGALYLTVGIAQALLREGFDLGRHALSLLANGSGGWVQTMNFVVSGVLVVAAAIGIQRALRGHSRMAGWPIGAFGVSMLLAAVFPADPMDGFPVGTPEGVPASVSPFGIVHFIAGGLGFLALAIGCSLVGVAMSRRGDAGVSRVSHIAGVAILAGFFAPAFVPASGPVAGIWFSVVVGWVWLAFVCTHLLRSSNEL